MHRSIYPLLAVLFVATALAGYMLAASGIPGALALILLAAIALLASFALYRYLLRPIKTLSQIADQISSKDLSLRMPEDQAWEISELAEFSNYMLDRMAAVLQQHEESRDELKLILSSIEDALWVQDYDGHIELYNPQFAKLFQKDRVEEGLFCWEVIQEPELLRLIKEVSDYRKGRISEIELNEHSYLLSASLNREAGKFIFILQNIDEIKATQQMKRDFAMNVAHELRTPLTAIKGFVEIVDEEYPSNRYLGIIRRHTNRLIALVKDLEDLARLERAPQNDIQDISLKTFFANIRSIFETALKEKGLDLKIIINPEDLRANLDPYRMEQVFVNLIDNAIRYTMTGEIRIQAHQEENTLYFAVSDTGKGIARDQIPRVFERFYTVDQSRSRTTGGTGLGLAIAKHIVLSHQGKISLESTMGEGSSFYIEIPQST